jgi:hypothetical protein
MFSDVKPTPAAKRVSRFPCVFRGAFVREQVDPRVKTLWESTTGKPAPFGRLRMNFQREHCRAINPYGSDDCPYREEECAMAFLGVVQSVLLPWIADPAAYFVKVAKSTGIDRADNKPLARERHREEGSSDTGRSRRGSAARYAGDPPLGNSKRGDRTGAAPVFLEETDLHRSHARPQSIGDVLGTLYAGAREKPSADRTEGSE